MSSPTRAWINARYATWRAAGKCGKCGKVPAAPGKSMCLPCRERAKVWLETQRGREAEQRPARFRTWTRPEETRLSAAHASGQTLRRIAAALGRSVIAVESRVIQRGLTRPRIKRTWTAEQDARLRELHAAGLLYREIGSELGVTTQAVCDRAYKLKLKRGRGVRPESLGRLGLTLERCPKCSLRMPCGGCPSIDQYAGARRAG